MQLTEVTTDLKTRAANGHEVVATVDCYLIDSTFAEAADCKSRSTNSHAKCSDRHHGMARLFFIQLI